jgi:hypothetical protein
VLQLVSIDPRAEFSQVRLGDRRLQARLELLVSALYDAPDRSFPSAMGSEAELEAAYRFFQNGRVTLDRLIEPHLEATAVRARLASDVLVLHDTTEFRFEGMKQREGLGKLAGNGQGFFGHFALVVTERDRAPLGLGGVVAYTREPKVRDRARMSERERADWPSEAARWGELIDDVNRRIGDVQPIHVMDREADDFVLFQDMRRAGMRFVARMNVARKRYATADAETEALPIETLAGVVPIVATREVTLSARAGKRGGESERVHPVRDRRHATLAISAKTIELEPPRYYRKQRPPLSISIVRVVEISAPAGEMPVEWVLYSTEPVDTTEQVLRIVDAYRARWTIEEYFKALKTGCAIERRQLESLHSLLAALGVFAPLAVRMLALRNYAREQPDAPAAAVVSDIELLALRAIGRTKLSAAPTARDALLAVAALGGHLKRNGDPGWLTLARGFEKLDVATQVIVAMSVDAPRCDQS